ncbi:MAG: hypothetical protein KDM63_03550 [Verrucomicrobiae bacterium]|nr:hypothetical protein [Verrucomicrobiae bacterium]
MKRITWRRIALVFVAMLGAATVRAEETDGSVSVPVKAGAILNQHLFSDSPSTCGPTALANSLRFGTPEMAAAWNDMVGGDDTTRLRFLIDRWFRNQPSAIFPTKKRLSFDGVLEEDMAEACRELFDAHQWKAPGAGYLDRQFGESSPDFLTRVRKAMADSIEDGMPPILSLKTYVARRLKRMNDELAWEPAAHHWVVVTGVGKELRAGDLGFPIDLINPDGGYETTAFVYTETRQDFLALKGTEAKGQWLKGRPFLLVQAPGILTLRPKEADWPDRIIVVANFLIRKN